MPPHPALLCKPVNHPHRFHVIHRKHLHSNFFNNWSQYFLLDNFIYLNLIELSHQGEYGIRELQLREGKNVHEYLLG